MSYQVKCERCGTTAAQVWLNLDVGYWVTPSDWLLMGTNEHLCPPCKVRALEPKTSEESQN